MMPVLNVMREPPSEPLRPEDGLPVVIDVLRATTTIVTALYNGASHIKAVTSVQEGRDRCPPGALLCGERGGVAPEGFTMGNSPREYSRERVEGKAVWLTTTNGTAAIEYSSQHARPLCLAFSNLSATSDYLSRHHGPVTIVCAGSHGQACQEDFFLAGALASRLKNRYQLTAKARDAEMEFGSFGSDVTGYLRAVKHGLRLRDLGFEKDLEYCARVDICPILVGMGTNGVIVRLKACS